MLRKLAQAYADLARRARGSDGDARALRRDAMALAPELSQDARIADAQRALRDALGDAARWLAARVYKDGDDDSDFDADTRQSCVTLARYADDLVAAYARSLGDVTCAEALLCIARVASAEAPLSRAASGALGRSFEALLEQGSFEARWLALCGKLVLGTDPTRDDRLLAWLDLLLSARPWPRRPAIARALGHSTSTWSLLLAEGDALLASADEITRGAALLALAAGDGPGAPTTISPARALRLLDAALAAEPLDSWRAAALALGRRARAGDSAALERLDAIGAAGGERARRRHAAAALGALRDSARLAAALEAAREDDAFIAGAVIYGLDALADDAQALEHWLDAALAAGGEPARRAALALEQALARAGHLAAAVVGARVGGEHAREDERVGARLQRRLVDLLGAGRAPDDALVGFARDIEQAATQLRALQRPEPAEPTAAEAERLALRDLIDTLYETRHAQAMARVAPDADAALQAVAELDARVRRELQAASALAGARSSPWRLELARALGRAAAASASTARSLHARRRDAAATSLRLQSLAALLRAPALLADKALRRLLAAELARAICALGEASVPLREVAARLCVAIAERVDVTLLRELCRHVAALSRGAERDSATSLCEALLAHARALADETPAGEISAEAETLATARDAALLADIAEGARRLAGDDSPTARRLARLAALASVEPRTPSPRALAALVGELPAFVDSFERPLAALGVHAESSADARDASLLAARDASPLAARAAAAESALLSLERSEATTSAIASDALAAARREIAALCALLRTRRLLRPLLDALERFVSHDLRRDGPPTPAAWQAATVDLGPPHAANTADLPPQHLRGATPRLDDIEIISPLGSGGIGAVFAARQVSLDRMVAVKVLHPELARDPRQRERFRREAQMMARWHHPHIVRVYDFREADDGQAALLMELVDGERLGDMPSSALPPARLCAIGAAIADALAHAHAAGVVHRDVSPDNVLLRRDGTALLSDFGIALLSGARRLTGAALVLGKPRYMSPEQLRGGRDVPLAAADVYALGVLLYERLAGDAPFEHDTLLGLLMIKEAEQYEPLEQLAPQLPPALSRLVDRMLAADPDRRPSASEVARELAAIARP